MVIIEIIMWKKKCRKLGGETQIYCVVWVRKEVEKRPENRVTELVLLNRNLLW